MNTRASLCWAVVVLLGIFQVRPVFGQADPFGSGTDRSVNNVFLPAPREQTQALARARKAIAEERYTDAVKQLGRLITGQDGESATAQAADRPQDYFLSARGGEGIHVSLKTEAQRLLGSMPPKGREWYEVEFGSSARVLLDQAIAKGDVRKLEEAARLYFHTKAGYEATLLLGRNHLDQGRPLAAALCFKRLAETPAAGDYEPELSVLLATCWLYSNMPEKVGPTLAHLKPAPNRPPLRIGNRDVELFSDPGRALEWIRGIVGAPQKITTPEEMQWVMFRGNATRTASSAGDLPLTTPRWRVPTANNPRDEKLVQKITNQHAAQNMADLPSLHPLAVDSVILMRTPDVLLAVDFRTGKRVWQYPWDLSLADDLGSAGARPSGSNNATPRERELEIRLWQDAAYGQLSSDGNFAFILDDLGVPMANAFRAPVFIGPNGQLRQNRSSPKPYNQLVALQIKTEGKIQWKIGDADGQDEPKLAGAFFLGVPLPLMGQLYAIAEFNGEIRLVVLNAKTGQLEWQQQLALLESRTIQFDELRRLAGATPSFADGVLICPTSAGAAVAVDLSTRTLLWGYQYGPVQPEGRQAMMFRGGGFPAPPLGNRWADATVTIADGRVLLTPLESGEFHCLDLLSGKPAWPAQKREDYLYVGCIYDRNAVLVGKNRVTALRLADGKPAWAKPIEIPDSATVSGRGFYRDDAYYLPTSASQLVKLDLKQGAIAAQVATDGVLGNLICFRDEVVSHGVRGLASYFVIEPLRKRVDELLVKNPDDAWALSRLAELHLHDGKPTEAVATLRRAYQLNPQDDATRVLLVKTLLAAMRKDFASNRKLAAEVEQLVDQPSQRVEFLRLMATGLQSLGELDAALDAFFKLASVEPQSFTDLQSDAHDREQVTRGHTVRRDRWVQGRLAELFASATPAQRERLNHLVQARLDQALADGNVDALRRFDRFFAFHPLADQARLQLAKKLIEGDELLEAEQLLIRTEDSADPALAGASTAELARLLLGTKQLELAAIYFRKLNQRYADVLCRDGQTGRQLFAAAMAEADVRTALDREAWPYGQTIIKESNDPSSRAQTYSMFYPVTIQHSAGPVLPGISVAYDQHRTQMLTVRDGFGRELVQVGLARSDNRQQVFFNTPPLNVAKLNGHLLLLQTSSEVIAISTLRSTRRAGAGDAILWREDLTQLADVDFTAQQRLQQRSVAMPWGQSRQFMTDAGGRPIGMLGTVTRHGVVFQRLRELVCVEPLSGETVWSRNEIEPGSDLFGDDEFVFVVPPNKGEAMVVSALDGREVARREVGLQENRWTTQGRLVLSWTRGEKQTTLRLFDAWTGTDVLVQQVANETRGQIIGTDEFALLQPDGQFAIFSLRDGQPRVRANLGPSPALNWIRVLRSQDQYVLLADRQAEKRDSKILFQPLQPTVAATMVQTRVYAFDRRTGRSQWQVPAVIEDFSFVYDQPTEAPALTFLRQYQKKERAAASQQSAVLCIDKRDGRVVLAKDEMPSALHYFEITADRENKRLTVATPMKTFAVTFTDEPVAPAPPIQLGAESSVANQAGASGGLLESVFDAFKLFGK